MKIPSVAKAGDEMPTMIGAEVVVTLERKLRRLTWFFTGVKPAQKEAKMMIEKAITRIPSFILNQ